MNFYKKLVEVRLHCDAKVSEFMNFLKMCDIIRLGDQIVRFGRLAQLARACL